MSKLLEELVSDVVVPGDAISTTLTINGSPLVYTLVEERGDGGQGTLYKAQRGEDVVAVKVLHRRPTSAERERFISWQKLDDVAGVTHLLAHGVSNLELRNYAVVSDYVDGATLEKLRSTRPLPEEAVREILLQSATILGKVHARDVLHRDIKPSNIMIDHSGNVVIADFGAARDATLRTLSGTVAMGTLLYVAPEQYQGNPTPASDIHSLGLTMYYLMKGEHPSGMVGLNTPRNLYFEEFEGDYSSQLVSVVKKMCEHDVVKRHQTARAVLDDLAGNGLVVSTEDGFQVRQTKQKITSLEMELADFGVLDHALARMGYIPSIIFPHGRFASYVAKAERAEEAKRILPMYKGDLVKARSRQAGIPLYSAEGLRVADLTLAMEKYEKDIEERLDNIKFNYFLLATGAVHIALSFTPFPDLLKDYLGSVIGADPALLAGIDAAWEYFRLGTAASILGGINLSYNRYKHTHARGQLETARTELETLLGESAEIKKLHEQKRTLAVPSNLELMVKSIPLGTHLWDAATKHPFSIIGALATAYTLYEYGVESLPTAWFGLVGGYVVDKIYPNIFHRQDEKKAKEFDHKIKEAQIAAGVDLWGLQDSYKPEVHKERLFAPWDHLYYRIGHKLLYSNQFTRKNYSLGYDTGIHIFPSRFGNETILIHEGRGAWDGEHKTLAPGYDAYKLPFVAEQCDARRSELPEQHFDFSLSLFTPNGDAFRLTLNYETKELQVRPLVRQKN